MPAESQDFAARHDPPARARSAGARGVSIRGLGHSYGELRTIERLDLEARPHEVLGLVGPSGCGKSTLLELIAGLREPSAGEIAVGGASDPGRAARALRLHAPARPAAALVLGDRQRRPGAAQPRRCGRAEARRRAGALFERFGLAGFERPAPPSCPAGCASGSPSCARCSPASRCWPWTSRSPRSTRSPAPRCRSGWPGRCGPTRAPSSSSPTTSRRRSTSPTGSRCSRRARRGSSRSCGRPRRAPPDRDAAVTDPELRRRPRAGDARPARGRHAMKRWLLRRRLVIAALDRRLAGGRDDRGDRRRAAPRGLPRPLPVRHRRLAVGEPLAARRQRLGDAEGGAARLLLRAGRRARLRDRAAPLRDAAARHLSAAGRLADDPDHRRSPRSSSSGSATGSARSWGSSR